MAARTIRTTTTAEERPSPLAAPWDWAADVGRQQLAVATEGACAMFRGFEAMRAIQEQAARQASEHHAVVAQKLRKPCAPAELVALQADLLRFDVEAATRYWQQLAGAALEMNTELFACGARLVDTEDVFAPTAQRFLHS